ncbi:L-rhamnose mutarotase [Microcella sp.]|uniref:L-rhamnose mutarotase n=1 Tax=Microcella sp. TaxID=1913979 RepID=UPI00299F5456|nr:L-rhamnose mutarotase [Microcella sp.]MDX2026409.1 L-rhamnose mutarotase [Microcella sp.]
MTTERTRICFILQVRPDRLDEYRERHEAVWPDMLEALAATGWHNYSLFLDDNGLLVGYLETDDFAAAQAAMAETDVNSRWQSEMAPFFVELNGRPDENMRVLPLVFQLETQLAAIRDTPDRKTHS